MTLRKLSNFLFYIGIVFLSIFEISCNGIVYSKSITLYALLAYFVLNVYKLGKVKFNRVEISLFAIMLIFLFKAFVEAIYFGKIKYLSTYINAYIVVLILYISVRIFFVIEGKRGLDLCMKILFWSTSIFAGLQGILQLLYVYCGKSDIIYKLVYLSHADFAMAHLKAGRISLQFTEPSFVGQGIILLAIIPFLYLQQYENSKKRTILTLIDLILCMFSLSVNTIYMLVIFIILYIALYNKNVVRALQLICIGGGIAIILLFLIKNIGSGINQMYLSRYTRVFGSGYEEDGSMVTRICLLGNAVLSFLQRPIFGYGTMQFGRACYENMYDIGELLNVKINKELLAYRTLDSVVYSHSVYFTQIAENGLLGILFCIILIKLFVNPKKSRLKQLLGVFFTLACVQLEIIAPYIVFGIALIGVDGFGDCEEKKILRISG